MYWNKMLWNNSAKDRKKIRWDFYDFFKITLIVIPVYFNFDFPSRDFKAI